MARRVEAIQLAARPVTFMVWTVSRRSFMVGYTVTVPL